MGELRTIGLALLIVGLLLVNFTFLHDVLTWENRGWIWIGPKSWVGIAIGWVATLAGAVALWRAAGR